MEPRLKTHACGKWVLAGEHAVLRGGSAIVFPYADVGVNLSFKHEDSALTVEPGVASAMIHELVRIAEAFTDKRLLLRGVLSLHTNIPMRAGLGSSAALCVALARFLIAEFRLQSDLIELATRMENHFHLQSSGMDVTACAIGEPILFSRSEGYRPLSFRRFPKFTLHDTGLQGDTAIAVKKVNEAFAKDPELGRQIDSEMAEAVRLSRQGLELYQTDDRGLSLIADGMDLAQDCFKRWGLLPEPVLMKAERLREQGALGVKITGAGMGGYLIELSGN